MAAQFRAPARTKYAPSELSDSVVCARGNNSTITVSFAPQSRIPDTDLVVRSSLNPRDFSELSVATQMPLLRHAPMFRRPRGGSHGNNAARSGHNRRPNFFARRLVAD